MVSERSNTSLERQVEWRESILPRPLRWVDDGWISEWFQFPPSVPPRHWDLDSAAFVALADSTTVSMKRFPVTLLALSLFLQVAVAQSSAPAAAPSSRGGGQARKTPAPPIKAKPEELAKIREKTGQIAALVRELKAKRATAELVTDVEVFAHAGRMLLEYPDMFSNQAAIEHAFTTLDQGIERGRQLQSNQPQWSQGKKRIHAYTSEIDGAILPDRKSVV